MTISNNVKPFVDGRAQPDSQHGADLEYGLSQQTQAIAYRMAGSKRTISFGAPLYATTGAMVKTEANSPVAKIASSSSWYSFEFDNDSATYRDMAFQIPWLVADGFSKVGVMVAMFAPLDTPLLVRLVSDDLIDAVATTNGDSAVMSGYEGTKTQDWNLAKVFSSLSPGERDPQVFTGVAFLEPTLPASRTVAIYPQVQTLRGNNPSIDFGDVFNVYIKSVTIFDIPDDEAGL